MKLRALSDQERLSWHRLAQSESIGAATFQKLIERFDTADEAIAALPDLSRRKVSLYDAARAEADFARASQYGAFYLALCEPSYPELLRQSPGPPPLICVKGRIGLLEKPSVAIVGARNASAVGMRFTRTLSSELGGAGFSIVSGLARGIDRAAHDASLSTGTIAVVAGGIDHIYPPENASLHDAIGEQGLLVAEMPLGTAPKAEYFPRRNRVIAGLSLATIVVEAALRSGSLSTARLANEAGRDVFAVPGSPLDPRCEGTNGLIKDGAHMLMRAADVINVLGSAQVLSISASPLMAMSPAPASDDVKRRVLELLSPTPIDLDDLVREAGAAPDQVLAVIMELEIAGQVQRLAGGRIARLS
ncbi:DNA-processing protein DprA [Aestuariivirga litoralis]|uniref:DNA-processing protein DprA n=1 Tax=Aestuariivirga litoralis TaxID=2650924 RepID=UPI0018C71C28|nr:DNA-processing protein DprA [Aestuariivirga litoralis]MBG1231607.1 DNA-protecting protein DprA [Aestuariivirga litoralis]